MACSLWSSHVGTIPCPSGSPVSRDEGRAVLWLAGEHDIATVPVVLGAVADATLVDDTDLVVDLSGVTFMGAATIGALIGSRNHLLRQSRNLTLRSPSQCARRVIDVCGLSHLIESA